MLGRNPLEKLRKSTKLIISKLPQTIFALEHKESVKESVLVSALKALWFSWEANT